MNDRNDMEDMKDATDRWRKSRFRTRLAARLAAVLPVLYVLPVLSVRQVLLVLSVVLPARADETEVKKPPPPLVACIEPRVMRTELARLLPGSRLTVVVPAREEPLGLARLTKDEFVETGLKWEEFMEQASSAAAAHLKTLKPKIQRTDKGVAQYAVLKSESHLTAGIVLCPEFFAQFRETFGDRLVVLVPDRFTVYVFPRGFSDFQNMGPSVLDQYFASVWPCSEEAFEITSDGIRCLGVFDPGRQLPEIPKPAPAAVPAAKPDSGRR
jgi:hypothetical protein